MDAVGYVSTVGGGGALQLQESLRQRVVEHAEPQGSGSDASVANEMKNVRKQRLERMVLQDPELARTIMVAQSSPVYNAKGDLIASLGAGGGGSVV
ncbi:MAG: hypothetical protein AB7E47_17415 [Desulfovibrionaceae bacterium]